MSMSDKNRMFVAQSNDNEYLYQDQIGDLGRILFRYYSQKDAQSAIKRAGHTNQCHVVELVEAPAKIVVNEDEAEMLEQATCDDDPAELIVGFVNSRYKYDEDGDAEDRLMRAYVIGYTVAKEKKYNVKVPLVQAQGGLWFFINSDDKLDATYLQGLAKKFTLEEIEHHGLHDCEKTEVPEC